MFFHKRSKPFGTPRVIPRRPASRYTLALTTCAVVLLPVAVGADPQRLSGMGDSISQGFSANGNLGDHPNYAFGQGTDSSVDSMYTRYLAKNAALTKAFVSVSGAEMVGGSDNAAAQASRICGQTPVPNRVVIELGGNDVCNRNSNPGGDPTANLYSVTTYRNGLKAALNTLGGCMPSGSVVQVMSMPRVDYLYEAGTAKRSFYCPFIWGVAGICSIVTGETSASRRRQIGAVIDQYNGGLQAEVQAAQATYGTKVHFMTDWQGPAPAYANTSIGTYQFSATDINGTDCFHPYYNTGQEKLACVAWQTGEYGSPGNIHACLGQ